MRQCLAIGAAPDIYESAPVGVAVTSGPDHRLVYTNHAFQRLVGERPLGLPIRKALRDLRHQACFELLDTSLRTGESFSLEELPFEVGAHDPTAPATFVSLSMARISHVDGEPGLLIMIVDITKQLRSDEAMRATADERRRFLERYRSLIELNSQAVWVNDARGRTIEPNQSWHRYSGQTWEEYRGFGWLDVVHPDDREATERKWLEAMDKPTHWDEVYRLRTSDGTYRHVRTRGVPIVENGRVVEWVGSVTDVEQEWQEERRRRLLERAGAATAHLARLEDVLRALAEEMVPALANACDVYVLPERELQSFGQPYVVERVLSLPGRRTYPPADGPHTILPYSNFARSVEERRPLFWSFPKGRPYPSLQSPPVTQWFVEIEANSVAVVPVVVDGSVAAVVTAVTCGDRDPISAADVDLLSRMLDHAHTHLSNAMRFQRTQRIALALQQCLLPEPPRVPGLEISARYRASTTAPEIGGDWYDSFSLPDGATMLTVGDVAGHDLTAAVAMSQLRNMLRGLAMDRRELPGDILRRLNVISESLDHDGTTTCVLARLDDVGEEGRRLTYSLAGHPPPLLVTRDGAARYLEEAAEPLLGVAGDLPRGSAVATLPPDSTLLLYTDGLVQLAGEDLDHGLERLRRRGASLAMAPLDDFCDSLLADLPEERTDDIAMIAVRLPSDFNASCGTT
ncbi:SpoIIE family protein phosphatase [Nonomuraea maritima]|uniref:SpoIIE family protein phosphatase n=1 Tax=Nonomuraea maritima TaxID=683260 RepID=UPI003718B861